MADTMTLKEAVKIALECMAKIDQQYYKFDANLNKTINSPATNKAYAKHVRIVKAMQRLEELSMQGRLFD